MFYNTFDAVSPVLCDKTKNYNDGPAGSRYIL